MSVVSENSEASGDSSTESQTPATGNQKQRRNFAKQKQEGNMKPKYSKGPTSRSQTPSRTVAKYSGSRKFERVRRTSSDSGDYMVYAKEWEGKDRRERRFTKSSFFHLHERADDVTRNNGVHQGERENRLQEMADVMENMDDYMKQYRTRKDLELSGLETQLPLKVNWKKFPKPGSKPKVTFKPEYFVIKQGWMYKKGLRRSRWYKRFFRIFLDDPHSLYYYKSANKAETDSRVSKNSRQGKKINLLFANVDVIGKYGKYHKQLHNNKNIVRSFEFFIQSKTVKKIVSPPNKTKTRTVLGRVFFLCAISETDAKGWVQTLKYVEEQTDSCIRAHQAKIKEGLDLKRQSATEKTNSHSPLPIYKPEESFITNNATQKKWDRAQMLYAYGIGISEAVAGKRNKLIIQDGFKSSNRKKMKSGLNLGKLSVVLESAELHYDLEVFEISGVEGQYYCEYLVTRRGEYELSILYEGCDIYGSPFTVRVLPSPACALQTWLSGESLLVNPQQTGTTLQINFRNQFEEKVSIRESDGAFLKVIVPEGADVSNRAEIESIPCVTAEDVISVHIRFNIDWIKQHLDSTGVWACCISVRMNDMLSSPSFLREIKGSPFTITLFFQEPITLADKNGEFELKAKDPSFLNKFSSNDNLIFPNTNEIADLPAQTVVSKGVTSNGEELNEVPRANSNSLTPATDSKLWKLFDKHETVLKSVYKVYSTKGLTNSYEVLLQLGVDYDFIPTFISNEEVRRIVQILSSEQLTYRDFIFCLAEIAIVSLSKPMFNHLYSSDKSKVNVLLNMWGLADPEKLSAFAYSTN